MGGIDVEVDHRRALLLIEGVAEGGLVEAMEKLVNMYRNGEGVEQNYRTAIEWQANCGIFTAGVPPDERDSFCRLGENRGHPTEGEKIVNCGKMF